MNRAIVFAVHPACGGGSVSLAANAVRIEALLTNVVHGLSKVVRLGWLLAMLPAALQSSKSVELSQLTPFTIVAALPAWQIELAADSDIVATLLAWWNTYLDTKPAWGIALSALNRWSVIRRANESLAFMCGNSLLLGCITLRSRHSPQTPM